MRNLLCKNPYVIAAGVGLAALLANAGGAWAGSDDAFPKISGEIAFEIENDYAFSSDDATEEFNNLFLKIEPVVKLAFSKELSINTGLVLEQVQEPAIKGDNRVFDDQGLFVEVLTLDYETGAVHLSGGKMGVNFGTAWDVTPGVYGTDLAGEYEMAENIGLLASYSHDMGAAGSHKLTAQTFFLDTSGLAESAFTRRQKTRQAAGGPGNAGDFSSFALSLDGEGFEQLPGFGYHVAYVQHTNDTVNSTDETRFAVGGRYEFKLSGDVGVQPLVEYARFDDADGTANQDRSYVTTALGFTYGNWNAAIAGTFKETEAADGTDTNEEQFQVSAGYLFPIGVGVDLGYKRARNAGVDTDTVGALVTYGYSF
ncbi:MAG: hypothetical protein HOK54_04965 [Alphaproteobacteria bacterium]|jgi:hypothetical protein|nr:hypothetical protein [Alphaproteobacteria bacterium]